VVVDQRPWPDVVRQAVARHLDAVRALMREAMFTSPAWMPRWSWRPVPSQVRAPASAASMGAGGALRNVSADGAEGVLTVVIPVYLLLALPAAAAVRSQATREFTNLFRLEPVARRARRSGVSRDRGRWTPVRSSTIWEKADGTPRR